VKRLLTFGTAAAIAFSSGTATAGSAKYSGQLDAQADSAVSFKVKKKKGVRRVKNVLVERITIECSGGGTYYLDFEMDGPGKVKNGSFKLKGGDAFFTLVFEGRLAGRSASGTARYSGFTQLPEGDTQGCDSGAVPWTASR
jgi:hypothetical protein